MNGCINCACTFSVVLAPVLVYTHMYECMAMAETWAARNLSFTQLLPHRVKFAQTMDTSDQWDVPPPLTLINGPMTCDVSQSI